MHGNVGVGRTGTIILCDICLRMAAGEEVVDILKVFQKMRTQRPNMVDNVHQYKLAHFIILQCLVDIHSDMIYSNIKHNLEQLINEGVENQMIALEHAQSQDQKRKLYRKENEKVSIVAEKNRFHYILPGIFFSNVLLY